MLKHRVGLKGIAQLRINRSMNGVIKRAGKWMLFDASPKVVNAEVEDRHLRLERIIWPSTRLVLRGMNLAKAVIVAHDIERCMHAWRATAH